MATVYLSDKMCVLCQDFESLDPLMKLNQLPAMTQVLEQFQQKLKDVKSLCSKFLSDS